MNDSTFILIVVLTIYAVLLYLRLRWYSILTGLIIIVLTILKLNDPTIYVERGGISYYKEFWNTEMRGFQNVSLRVLNWHEFSYIIFVLFLGCYVVKGICYLLSQCRCPWKIQVVKA